MGGNAFPDLHIPRISPAEYANLCSHFSEAVRALYGEVVVPPECPGKIDHGDIDILAADPRDETGVNVRSLAAALGARSFRGSTTGGSTASFAVPKPLEGADDFISDKDLPFVQVDVHICRPGTLEWENFTKSYGDLWNIVGSQIRGAGLTANDRGFFVRNPEIEELDRKKAMVYLTRDPARVLEFLGLDHEAFEKGWNTPEEMYEWATHCRFFDVGVFREKGEYLKANDRKRLKLRAVYRDFVFNYVPSIPVSPAPDSVPSREEVMQQALNVFEARAAHDDLLREYRLELKQKQAWDAVSEALSQPSTNSGKRKKGQLMTLLKRRISLKPGVKPDITETDFEVPNFIVENGGLEVEALVKWVTENEVDLRLKIKGAYPLEE
ncbi:MAG: hypothetical protein M1814_001391 [Vezdaea aestivalis]|nr:MAG: hypothetical protein M1814_001391 [Vezdaea aestivalis]